MSYGSQHGAAYDGNADNFTRSGLARVKQIFVKPSWVGASEDDPEDLGTGMLLAEPPWYSYDKDRAADSNGILDHLKGTGQSPGTRSSSGATAEQQDISSNMATEMSNNASPSTIGGAATDFKSLLASAVDSRLYHKKTWKMLEEKHSDYIKSLGENTYSLRYIYYGDILDWAIRKALWRPPYTPDQAYIALDTFSDMAKATPEAGLYTSWKHLEGLSEWDDGRKKVYGGTEDNGVMGPDGKKVTINDFVEDLERLKERKYDKINIVLGCVEYFDPVAMKNVIY